MKSLSLLACLMFCLNAHAARSPRLRDEVAKIAVGPKAAATPTQTAVPISDDEDRSAEPAVATPDAAEHVDASNDADASNDGDATDNVDRPIERPSVITTDAPRETSAHSSKPTSPPPVTEPPAIGGPKARLSKEPLPSPVREEKAKQKHVVDGVSAEQSLKWLENGNIRYASKRFRGDGRSEKDRARTSKEAKPHAIVLSCSDSRVPPELIFDQGLGEITTIRVAGEVLDQSVIASIEESLMTEHPHLLVVLGHTQCSAIEAVTSWKEKATYGSDALDRMVSEIKPHLKTLKGGSPSSGLQVEAALQADGVARDLPERSAIIKRAVDSGELTIKTGLYWVDTGKVKFY